MCTSPHRVFKTGLRTESGKDLLYFDTHYPCPDRVSLERAERQLKVHIPYSPAVMSLDNGHAFLTSFVDVPCGKCDACQLAAARNWAHRCLMEAYYSHDNWFVTLTFDERFCPGLVDKKDLSSFMKRLRSALSLEGIRFFACGEYGEKSGRPHYHVILFDCPLKDLRLLDASKGLFVSPTVERCWPFGFHSIAEVTPEAISYVARYTSKKSPGRKGFLQMSRRPGIGCRYLLDHKDAYKLDYLPLFVNGSLKRLTPPRYYEKLFPELDWPTIKARRIENGRSRTRLECFIHGMKPERLDHYLRSGVYAAKRQRLQKHEL